MTSQPPGVGTAAYEVEITRPSVTANTILVRDVPSHEVNTTQPSARRIRGTRARLTELTELTDERIKTGAEAPRCSFGIVSPERAPRSTGIEAFSKVSCAAPDRLLVAFTGTRNDAA